MESELLEWLRLVEPVRQLRLRLRMRKQPKQRLRNRLWKQPEQRMWKWLWNQSEQRLRNWLWKQPEQRMRNWLWKQPEQREWLRMGLQYRMERLGWLLHGTERRL